MPVNTVNTTVCWDVYKLLPLSASAPVALSPLLLPLLLMELISDVGCLDGGAPSDFFIEHPKSQSVTLNSTFILRCRFRIEIFQSAEQEGRPRIDWSRNGFGIGGTPEDIHQAGIGANYPESRYSLPYNLQEGQYDLQITNAQLKDDGKYVCQLTYRGNAYHSQSAIVEVLVPSKPPFLRQLDPVNSSAYRPVDSDVRATVFEGGILKLQCIAEEGKPGARLLWLVDGIPINAKNRQLEYFETFTAGFTMNVTAEKLESTLPPYFVTTISTLSAFVTKLHHGRQIQCRAENPGYEMYKSKPANTIIEVHFYWVNDLTYIIIIIIITTTTTTTTITTIILTTTTTTTTTTIIIIATTIAATTTTTIISPPQFLQTSTLLYAGSVGESARLECATDGNPPPRIEWRRGRTGDLLARGRFLNRPKIQPEDFGSYTCIATVRGYPSISKEIWLSEKTAPSIKPMEAVLAPAGAPARLTCTVLSVPLPPAKEAHWYRRGIRVTQSAHRTFESEEFTGGVVYVLKFSQVLPTDFGFYNCTASNGYGSASQTVELRQKDVMFADGLSSFNRHPKMTPKNNYYFEKMQPTESHTRSSPDLQKEEIYCPHSNSDSTEVDSYTSFQPLRYQAAPANVRNFPVSGHVNYRSAYSVGRLARSRSPPVCAYALTPERGIPVCANMAVALTNCRDLQLHNGSEICIPSFAVACPCTSAVDPEYQRLSINYINAQPSGDSSDSFQHQSDEKEQGGEETSTTTKMHHIGYVPLTSLPPNSDIILNTQVTNV
ncbi:unnamed protein product [Schistocephalus solidus]|uniref:Irregular chiasm C-roughest protein n=1 Tax=Schistocephalus solidus TaxID=70667 RepID=A0A183SL09_SCHSO|nr:unnamed protein product [Schistocephalus solidus]